MKALTVIILAVCSFTPASAQDADRVKLLEQRVRLLEERIARIEQAAAAGSLQSPEAGKMMQVARRHVAEERKKFPPEDIAKAEELYHRAAKELRSPASRPLLDSIVARYPGLNRAGCAQLYRAQQETGAEKERLLLDCIKRFHNCYYLDGTQVGPLATLQLADYYEQEGRAREARRLFRRLRNKSPEAVGHDGALLVSYID
jgi:hypothetical protein